MPMYTRCEGSRQHNSAAPRDSAISQDCQYWQHGTEPCLQLQCSEANPESIYVCMCKFVLLTWNSLLAGMDAYGLLACSLVPETCGSRWLYRVAKSQGINPGHIEVQYPGQNTRHNLVVATVCSPLSPRSCRVLFLYVYWRKNAGGRTGIRKRRPSICFADKVEYTLRSLHKQAKEGIL